MNDSTSTPKKSKRKRKKQNRHRPRGGFYRRRRGILEHLATGRITIFDAGVHDFLCLNANSVIGGSSWLPPGVWLGSAVKIKHLTGGKGSTRKLQRSIQKLAKLGWIKSFYKRGKRGDYGIVIHLFTVSDGDGDDFLVDALNTTDWRHPKLVPVGGDGSCDVGHDVGHSVTPPTRSREIETGETEKYDVRRTSRANRSSLEENIGKKLVRDGGTLKNFLKECEGGFPPWWGKVLAACEYLGYELDVDDPCTSADFPYALIHVWEKWREELPLPRNFASKVIDECDKEHWLWPPSFEKHRDQLPGKEQAMEACEA